MLPICNYRISNRSIIMLIGMVLFNAASLQAEPPGYKLTPVHGDMAKDGVYCIRINMPAGTVLEPHRHPLDQCVTVLKGKLVIGFGEKFDFAQADTIPEHGYVFIPGGKIHFENFPEGTLVQIHGPGPLKTEKIKEGKK